MGRSLRTAARLRSVVFGVGLVALLASAGGFAWADSRAHVAASPQLAGCPMFPANNPINEEISNAPVNPNSAAYIASIGASGHLHASFASDPHYGMPYSIVPSTQRPVPIKITRYRRFSDPGPYPIPLNAPIQGEETPGGDHHLIVLQEGTCKLYEMYRASRTSGGFEAEAGVVFDLRSNALRPEGSGSADEAGLPIFPLLARYEEVRAGHVDHALRVIVPRTQRGYIHPATHLGSTPDPSLPPPGLRLRLKASFSLAGYHGQALVILQALKRYGLIVADQGGGAWSIGGAASPYWNDRELHTLETVPGSAFEAVYTGPVIRRPKASHRTHRRRR